MGNNFGGGYSGKKMSMGKRLWRKILEDEILVKDKILGMGTYCYEKTFKT